MLILLEIHTYHILCASGPVTRLKSQQNPKGKVEGMIYEKVQYTTKEQLDFSNLYKQKSGKHVMDWIPRVCYIQKVGSVCIYWYEPIKQKFWI